MSEGFIVVRRGWRENALFEGEFSRGEAWLWLIEHACWKPTTTRVNGATINLDRGELSFSVRFLADTWGWSKSKVDRFLADLRRQNMIETRSKCGTPRDQKVGQQAGQLEGRLAGHGQSVITICNYRKYQDVSDGGWDKGRDKVRDTTRSKSGTASGTNKNQINQLTKEEDAGASAPAPDQSKVFWDEAIAYLGAKSRPLIGRWIRDHGLPACVSALKVTKADNDGRGADQPIPFMTRVLANGAEREAARIEAERKADADFNRRFPPKFISPSEAAKLFDRDKLAQWLAETPEGRMV